MTRRLLHNPAVIVLGALVLLGMLGLNWSMGVLLDQQSLGYEGTPTEEQLWQLRTGFMAQVLPPWAVLTAVTALVGICIVGSATRRAERGAADSQAEPAAAGQDRGTDIA